MSSSIPEGPQEYSASGDPSLGNSPVPETSTINHESGEHLYGQIPDWFNNKWTQRTPGQNEFEVLLKPLLDRDAKQCNAWQEEVQNLLILAGLFSAVVTAFAIESYKTLRPDPNDQIISLLSLIADPMSAPNGNGSSFTNPDLVLSLTVALVGIVTLQWLREHQRYENGMAASQMFAIFNARSDGLKRWYVPQIFAGLPFLLQAALSLFLVGLVEFLFNINTDVAIPVAVVVRFPIVFLVVTTALPTLQSYTMHLPYFLRVNDHAPAPCPYKSPQALILQRGAVLSSALFGFSARVFSMLWIPFVIIIRIFVRNDKPFYGKYAPFSMNDNHYQDFQDRLRNAAGNWMSMDTQWLSVRTSYAVAIQTPITTRHSHWPYVSNLDFTAVVGFYDCVKGIKHIATDSDPTTTEYRIALYDCMTQMLSRLCDAWRDPLEAAGRDSEVCKALQAHFTALLRIIGPYGHRQTEKLVELSRGDISVVKYAFLAVLMDQALGSDFDFDHQSINYRVITHMSMTRSHLAEKAHELFFCSNGPGVIPSLSLSTRRSFLHHRNYLQQINPTWMEYVSHCWTQILKNVIIDTHKMIPSKPFTRKCTELSTALCGSNLHTDSIIELTEYILLFQVSKDIRDTLRLLRDFYKSKPNPLQDRPFVLIIACAYINAVANVNQDDVDEFHAILRTICTLCGSLDATLEASPHRKGQQWRSMKTALDYIRNYHAGNQRVPAATQSGLHRNIKAAENV